MWFHGLVPGFWDLSFSCSVVTFVYLPYRSLDSQPSPSTEIDFPRRFSLYDVLALYGVVAHLSWCICLWEWVSAAWKEGCGPRRSSSIKFLRIRGCSILNQVTHDLMRIEIIDALTRYAAYTYVGNIERLSPKVICLLLSKTVSINVYYISSSSLLRSLYIDVGR